MSETAELPALVAPAPYVTIPLAVVITGYTAKAIERKIERGDWLEGFEYHRDATGAAMIDIEGFSRWVEGKRPALAPVAPAAVSVQHRRSIEAIPTALYRHFDAVGMLLYVGVSLSPMARLSKHGDNSHWSKNISRVTMEWFPDRRSALAAETCAIRTEFPVHNIAGRRTRS